MPEWKEFSGLNYRPVFAHGRDLTAWKPCLRIICRYGFRHPVQIANDAGARSLYEAKPAVALRSGFRCGDLVQKSSGACSEHTNVRPTICARCVRRYAQLALLDENH